MNKFNVISLFPDFLNHIMSYGVTGRALQKGLVKLKVYNPRSFAEGVHQAVDDRPFGGGDGMVMSAEVLSKTLVDVRNSEEGLGEVVYLSPQGAKWNEDMAKSWSLENGGVKTLICGRYSGIDQRVIKKYKISEISIGDYILSGGELAALVVMDTVIRKIPGVLGHAESADLDSFSAGLLEAPLYTRPAVWKGMSAPKVLLSGHHKNIQKSQYLISLIITAIKRPELIQTSAQICELKQGIDEVLIWPEEDIIEWGLERQQILVLKEKYG